MHLFWVIVLMFPNIPPVDLPQHYPDRQTCEITKYKRLAAIAGTEGVNLDRVNKMKMDCQPRKE